MSTYASPNTINAKPVVLRILLESEIVSVIDMIDQTKDFFEGNKLRARSSINHICDTLKDCGFLFESTNDSGYLAFGIKKEKPMQSYKILVIGGDRGVHERQSYPKMREIGLEPTWHNDGVRNVAIPQNAQGVILFSDLCGGTDRKTLKKNCDNKGIPIAIITRQFGLWKDLLMKKFPIEAAIQTEAVVQAKVAVQAKAVIQTKATVQAEVVAQAKDPLDRVVEARNNLMLARKQVAVVNDTMIAAAELYQQAETMMADARKEYDLVIEAAKKANAEFDLAVESWKATDFAIGLKD